MSLLRVLTSNEPDRFARARTLEREVKEAFVIVLLVTTFACDLRIDFLRTDTVEPFLGER